MRTAGLIKTLITFRFSKALTWAAVGALWLPSCSAPVGGFGEGWAEGRFLQLNEEGVGLGVRIGSREVSPLVLLISLHQAKTTARLSFPGVVRAAVVNSLGEITREVEVRGQTILVWSYDRDA